MTYNQFPSFAVSYGGINRYNNTLTLITLFFSTYVNKYLIINISKYFISHVIKSIEKLIFKYIYSSFNNHILKCIIYSINKNILGYFSSLLLSSWYEALNKKNVDLDLDLDYVMLKSNIYVDKLAKPLYKYKKTYIYISSLIIISWCILNTINANLANIYIYPFVYLIAGIGLIYVYIYIWDNKIIKKKNYENH